MDRAEVRAIVCEIIQIIAGNHEPIFSDQPLRVSRYALASRIEERFLPGVVITGDRLDGWTTVEDVVDDVGRAMSRAARRKCEEAESAKLETRNPKLESNPKSEIRNHKSRRRFGATDPHVLVMIVILIAALVVPMTAALMAKSHDAAGVPSNILMQIADGRDAVASPVIERMPVVDPVNAPMLGSISAVVAATLISVNVLKRLLADAGPRMAWATIWPTWSYAVIVATIYTCLANLAFGTLHGSFGTLVWQSVYNAAIASGFFEWYRHRSSAIGDAGGKEEPFVDPRKGSQINW